MTNSARQRPAINNQLAAINNHYGVGDTGGGVATGAGGW